MHRVRHANVLNHTAKLAVLVLGLSACVDTQVLVHFTADQVLLTEATTLRVRVAASDETPGQVREQTLRDTEPLDATQPVSPFEGRSGRSFDVSGELVRADGAVIARQRAIGRYEDGARTHVTLHFSDACREVRCASEETCERGRCVPACVRTTSSAETPVQRITCLPSEGFDAGVPDSSCRQGCGVLERCDGLACVPETVEQLSSGERSTCALLASGRTVCWGRNACGELGVAPSRDPSSRAATEPHEVAVRAESLDCGYFHCCGLASSNVRCWGSNAVGQLARPEGTFSAPEGTCGSRDTPVTEYTVTPVLVPTCEASDLSVAGDYACALCVDGTVQCWGSNEVGQCGVNGPRVLRSPAVVPGVSNAVQLETGPFHACARAASGAVTCWGFGARGQLGRDETPVRGATAPFIVDAAVDLWLGLQHTCVLQASGEVFCAGAGETSQAGSEGEVLGPPLSSEDVRVPRVVAGLSSVTGLAASSSGAHTCARGEDETLRCWGAQGIRTSTTRGVDALGHGELGRGLSWTLSDDDPAAAAVEALRLPADGMQVVGGRNHTCALGADARVYCWGDDTFGQTSHGTILRSPAPVRAYSP